MSASVVTRLHSAGRARISALDRVEYFLRSRASKVVVLAALGITLRPTGARRGVEGGGIR